MRVLTDSDLPDVTVLVPCGGESRRFGADKTRAPLAGSTVLDRLLTGLPPHWPVVCVGPERPVTRRVAWQRESPPGGGPLAAVAAPLATVASPVLAVVAGDQPLAGPVALRLVADLLARPGLDGVCARQPDGRLNPLLAAYRTGALRRAVPADPAGRPAAFLLDVLEVGAVDADTPDVDTPSDLEALASRLDP